MVHGTTSGKPDSEKHQQQVSPSQHWRSPFSAITINRTSVIENHAVDRMVRRNHVEGQAPEEAASTQQVAVGAVAVADSSSEYTRQVHRSTTPTRL